MKRLNENDCREVVGGRKYSFSEWATLCGYIAGKGVDFAHGFWDGLMGVEKH